MSYPPPPTDPGGLRDLLADLRNAAAGATTDREVRALTTRIASITRAYRIRHGIGLPVDPLAQAVEINPRYQPRPHLVYLSGRIAVAVRDVEAGQNRMLAISMPPRAGKSTSLSIYTPLWILRGRPTWKVVDASYDPTLSAAWARGVRRIIEDSPDLGIALARDSGSGTDWQTEEGGGFFATSVRGPMTGRGAKVLIIDDPVKDFVEAHSATMREATWNWWLSVALNRLEPPYLVLVVMTRWHEDDMIGRLLSREHEGDPTDWEVISLAGLADRDDDPLGRLPGAPLLSPLFEETTEQAIARWEDTRRKVGTYTFSAMIQQRPAPAKGAVFDMSWWRFWSWDRRSATEDGRVVYLDPGTLTGGLWLDSWDAAFGETTTAASSYVVGQRWVRSGPNRYLIAQQRDRWSFTQTLSRMRAWSNGKGPNGKLVHKRLIEKKANGPAIINVMRKRVAGIKPITPTTSKEARARAVTPECESGHVYLPNPSDPGNEWVTDLLSELRNFPFDAHDDQVDSLTQALLELRDDGAAGLSVPGRVSRVPGSEPPGATVSRIPRRVVR